MRKSMALLVFALVLAGCGSHDKTEELQQKKMTQDLMKAQNEQLAAMMKSQNEQLATLSQKENDLRTLGKKYQDALREIQLEKCGTPECGIVERCSPWKSSPRRPGATC